MDQAFLVRLSFKELAVLALHQEGLSPAEIGKRLLMSEFSVNVFLENIQVKREFHEGTRTDEL